MPRRGRHKTAKGKCTQKWTIFSLTRMFIKCTSFYMHWEQIISHVVLMELKNVANSGGGQEVVHSFVHRLYSLVPEANGATSTMQNICLFSNGQTISKSPAFHFLFNISTCVTSLLSQCRYPATLFFGANCRLSLALFFRSSCLFVCRLGRRRSGFYRPEPDAGHRTAGRGRGAAWPHASHRAAWGHPRYVVPAASDKILQTAGFFSVAFEQDRAAQLGVVGRLSNVHADIEAADPVDSEGPRILAVS